MNVTALPLTSVLPLDVLELRSSKFRSYVLVFLLRGVFEDGVFIGEIFEGEVFLDFGSEVTLFVLDGDDDRERSVKTG